MVALTTRITGPNALQRPLTNAEGDANLIAIEDLLNAHEGIFSKLLGDSFTGVVANSLAGVDATGLTDSTIGLRNALQSAVADSKVLVLKGNYKISGALLPYTTLAVGNLAIHCVGRVTITVAPESAAFSDILYFGTTAANNASITGGQLVIDGNYKAANGITVRHSATASTGAVVFSAPVSVANLTNTDANSARENAGIAIIGRYRSVSMNSPAAVNVTRTNPTSATKGVVVSGVEGTCVIRTPYVENVYHPAGGFDADGLAVFAYSVSSFSKTSSTCLIESPILVNCSGRGFKGQISHITISDPKVYRNGGVAGFSSSADIDLQVSGYARVIRPYFEYRSGGGNSPLGASHAAVCFQQTLDNATMDACVEDGVLCTEVAVPRYCSVILNGNAKDSSATVAGLSISNIGSFAGSSLTRAVLEIDASLIAAKSSKTQLNVSRVSGLLGAVSCIGYTGAASNTSLSTKLSIRVENCSTDVAGSAFKLFSALSGNTVLNVEKFHFASNFGARTLLDSAMGFDFSKLVPGSSFTVWLGGSGTFVNPPPWGTNGYAYVECLQTWFASTDAVVRVTVNGGDKSSMRFFTTNGGVTWFSENMPEDSSANISLASAQVNTRNKMRGQLVFDNTNLRLLMALGSSPTSAWVPVQGGTQIVPA